MPRAAGLSTTSSRKCCVSPELFRRPRKSLQSRRNRPTQATFLQPCLQIGTVLRRHKGPDPRSSAMTRCKNRGAGVRQGEPATCAATPSQRDAPAAAWVPAARQPPGARLRTAGPAPAGPWDGRPAHTQGLKAIPGQAGVNGDQSCRQRQASVAAIRRICRRPACH